MEDETTEETMSRITAKIVNHEQLDDSDAAWLRSNRYLFTQVDELEGEDSRWTTSMLTIISIDGTCYGFTWERGLTEMQESDAYAQTLPVMERETSSHRIKTIRWTNVDTHEGSTVAVADETLDALDTVCSDITRLTTLAKSDTRFTASDIADIRTIERLATQLLRDHDEN